MNPCSLLICLLVPAIVIKGHTTSTVNISSNIEQMVESYFAYTNTQNCTGFVDLFAGGFSVEDPNGSPPVHSPEDVLEGCKEGGQVFTLIDVAPTNVHIAGLGAAVNFKVARSGLFT